MRLQVRNIDLRLPAGEQLELTRREEREEADVRHHSPQAGKDCVALSGALLKPSGDDQVAVPLAVVEGDVGRAAVFEEFYGGVVRE